MDLIQLNNLEVDLSVACNLKCAHCTHDAPFTKIKNRYELDEFTRDLDILGKYAKIKNLRFVGGEPLIHPGCLAWCKTAYEHPAVESVTVFTNGVNLYNLARYTDESFNSVFRYIHKLRVSIYNLSPKAIKDIAQGIHLVKKQYPDLDVEFNRITHFTAFKLSLHNSNPLLVDKIYKNCIYSTGEGLNLRSGTLYRCFVSWRRNHIKADDFIHLYDVDARSLSLFLSLDTPLRACEFCLGCSGKPFVHTQASEVRDNYMELADGLDFEAGKVYLSNLLYSWARNDPEALNHTTFYDAQHLNMYLKYFAANAEVQEILDELTKRDSLKL